MAQRSQKVKYLYFKVLIRDTKILKRKKTAACRWNNWLHLLKTYLPQNPITCLQNFSLVLSFMVFFQQETSYVSQTDQNLAVQLQVLRTTVTDLHLAACICTNSCSLWNPNWGRGAERNEKVDVTKLSTWLRGRN